LLCRQDHPAGPLNTYSMEKRSSLKAKWFSASQEIPSISWNPKVHYRDNKCPPPVPIPSQLDPVHAPHATSWRSVLILSSHQRLLSSKRSVSLRFSHQGSYSYYSNSLLGYSVRYIEHRTFGRCQSARGPYRDIVAESGCIYTNFWTSFLACCFQGLCKSLLLTCSLCSLYSNISFDRQNVFSATQ
jgi:hypothetical protein